MSNQEQELEQSAELINDEQQTPDVAEPAVATDELSALRQQLSAAEAAAQEKDRALRIAAEMENLRRRARRSGCREGAQVCVRKSSPASCCR